MPRPISEYRKSAPPPSRAALAEVQEELQLAVYGGISERDVTEIMKSMVDKAKRGDIKAARLVLDIIRPTHAPAPLIQNNVGVGVNVPDCQTRKPGPKQVSTAGQAIFAVYKSLPDQGEDELISPKPMTIELARKEADRLNADGGATYYVAQQLRGNAGDEE